MMAHGRECSGFDPGFARETIRRTALAVRQALADPAPVTHIGTGKAKVEKFASTRRLLGMDGRVKHTRYTSTSGKPELREFPEGLIDPHVRVISYWNQDDPLAVSSYYATHPQSYYREGGISCDTVGIARNERQEATGIFHVHLNGAGGNIGAGKYNDGSHQNRQILANRLAAGIKKAWESTTKTPVTAADFRWNTAPVQLPPAIREEDMMLTEEELVTAFREEPSGGTAADLAWVHRCNSGRRIILSGLHLGPVSVLHMPGELNVEYQLAAVEMQPDRFVSMAAYGDYGPGYICTRSSYPRGGYEAGSASRVAPEVEDVLTAGMQELLDVSRVEVTPSDFTEQKQRFS